MKAQTILLFLVSFFMLLPACNEEPKPNVIPGEIELTDKSKDLINADNEFGLELFQNIAASEVGNFMISPLSISLALAMTYNGAVGETKTAMEEAMKLAGLSTEEINQSYKDLIESLLSVDPQVTMEIAQSIWYRQGYNVLDDFISINKNYYDAEVRELDFSRSDAKDIINAWIADRTHDKIKNMIKFISPAHVMFLINAIYFKGSWQTEFDPDDTHMQDFYLENETSVEVDMMRKEEDVNYLYNETFSAIQMNYGRGNYNMTILLPNDDKTCADIEAELNQENWDNWMSSFYMKSEMTIQMPKFKSKYSVKLNDILKAMGMEIAFNPNADFSGINGTGGIWIDYVQHDTFIEVNEEGTEAAAATVVAMNEMTAAGNFFIVNKPFIYAITEAQTGAIVFIGKMKQP